MTFPGRKDQAQAQFASAVEGSRLRGQVLQTARLSKQLRGQV